MSGFGLQNDTGTSGDNATEDPTVKGTVGNSGPGTTLYVEIDYTGDNGADDWFAVTALESFTYDPSNHIQFGPVTIQARVVELGFETSEMRYGEWVSLTINYQPPPNNPPSISSLALVNDTGEPGDNATQDPNLKVMVANEGGFNNVVLDIDYNGDGMVDDWTTVAADGSVEFDPSSHIQYGQVTVKVRAAEMSMHTSETLFSEWVSITFQYQPPPNAPPTVASLRLKTDTGEMGDNITQNPTLIGTITNDGGFGNIYIEVDYNGDQIVDNWYNVNGDGDFEFNPSAQIGAGQHTISVRAIEMDFHTTQYLSSGWVSITLTFEDQSSSS